MVLTDSTPVTGTNTDQVIDNGTFRVSSSGWTLAASGAATTASHDAVNQRIALNQSTAAGEASMTHTITMVNSSPYYQYNGFTGSLTFDTVDVLGDGKSKCYYKMYYIDAGGSTERIMASGGPITAGNSVTHAILAETSGAVYEWPLADISGGGTAGYSGSAYENKVYLKIWTEDESYLQHMAIDNVSCEMNTMTVVDIADIAASCSVAGVSEVARTAATKFKKSDRTTQAGSYKWFHDAQYFQAAATDHYGYQYGTRQDELDSHRLSPRVEAVEGRAVPNSGHLTYASEPIGHGLFHPASMLYSDSAITTDDGTSYYPFGNNDRATITFNAQPDAGCVVSINGYDFTEGVDWARSSNTTTCATNLKTAISKKIRHPDPEDVNAYGYTFTDGAKEAFEPGSCLISYHVDNSAGTITAVNIMRRGSGFDEWFTQGSVWKIPNLDGEGTGYSTHFGNGLATSTDGDGTGLIVRISNVDGGAIDGDGSVSLVFDSPSSSRGYAVGDNVTVLQEGSGNDLTWEIRQGDINGLGGGAGVYGGGQEITSADYLSNVVNMLESGTGFATSLPQDIVWEPSNAILPAYGEVASVRTGYADSTSTDNGTTGVMIDTATSSRGENLYQRDDFWKNGTIEITEGTGIGTSATITSSDRDDRSVTFPSLGVLLDTTSKYRLTSVGTRGLQSIAIRNAGSGYRMHIPFEAQWNGTAEDGVDSSGNVVTVYSPWSGDSNSATHVCDFVGFQKQAFWNPCPRNQSPEYRGTIPMPMQTISTGEKQPYYSKTATHSKTLGASYQICAAYPTDSGKVTPKASYAITTDDSTNITVTAFSGSTASLYMATLPYGGFDDIFQTGNGLTWQRNKYYERYKSLNLSYPTGNVSDYYTDDDNSPHLIVQSTSKTHDLTAFNTLASAATTYWDEKLVIKAYMSVDDATASTGMGYVDPRWSGTFPLGDTLGIGGNVIVPYHQAGNAKYFFPDVQHYLLDWKYQGDELPNAGTTYFTHLYSQWGFDQDNTDYGYYAVNTAAKLDASHKLAATAQTYSTSVGPITIPYGTSMEDGNWLTLLATLPSGAKPQGGSYTYEWITTKTGLLATPPVDIKFNIDKAGKTDDTGTFYIDEGDGGIDSGISPAKTSITNLTAEGDASFNYDVYWGWLSGTTFTGLSATDFQKVGTEVSNAPSTETNGPKITTGVTRDSAHQVSANSTYINDVPDQTLLFNSSIATSQGHPSYVEYVVKLTGSNGGDCAATTYSNPIRIYRDLSAATGTLGAVISYSSDSIMETESITFNALDSTPGNSDTIGGSSLLYGHTYSWDFTYDSDDGHQNDASGLTVTRTYSTSEVGPQTVRLLMTDFDGDTTSATKTVTINDRVGVPDELVVQVYQSEALAIEGSVSNALQAYSNTGKLTIADNFYLYRDYWYRIESNDAVDGFYIDWDDGEDNSPEKANSQTILLDEPQFFTVVPHTYTKNDRFFPMVRAIKNNIYSKYYTNGVTSAQLAAQASDMSISINSTTNDYSALEGETLENGNNEFSIVHIDSFGEEQTRFLPFLEPRNIPPVGILKTDRNAVFAGIDNSVIGTAADASREVYLDDDTGVAEAADGYIEADIIYEDINGKIITDTWNTWANKKSAAIAVKRILSLKLTNLLENTTGPEGASNIKLKSGDRLYLKTDDADEVVAMVSHGSPYITEEQSQYYVIADGGESRTRASNNSISGYYFTDGISNSTTLGVLSSGTQTSDVYNSGTFNYTNTKRKFTYTFDESNYKHFKDPDDRFYDYEVLIKLQVKDNHTDYSGYDRYSYSEIHDYNNDVYNTSITPDFLKRNSSLRFYNSSSWSTPSWASESTALSTLVDSGSYGDGANNAFLITDDTKQINRLFFQVKHASGLSLNTSARDPKIRISVMYSGKNDAGGTIWKPVPFVTTTSLPDYSDSALYRSGVISFNMPEDWVKTIHSDITWKTFPPVDTAWDYSSYGLIILMEVDTSSATVGDIDIMSIWPYDDENVQLVTVQDPHHVSLSGVGVSQSVGFVRNAKNVDITDKLGRSTFKRMGVAASNLTFGGVQLSGDYTTTYDALRKYQVNNTPVYYDLQRADDSYIRFFGVINQLSEDYPVGMQHPKFGISMQISKIIEFTSAGVWSHDTPISIGGKVGDEPKYTS